VPPKNFNLKEYLQSTSDRCRDSIGRDSLTKRQRARIPRSSRNRLNLTDDWDRIIVADYSESEMFELLAGSGDSAKIHGPIGIERDLPLVGGGETPCLKPR
jgi:hypothetical protein